MCVYMNTHAPDHTYTYICAHKHTSIDAYHTLHKRCAVVNHAIYMYNVSVCIHVYVMSMYSRLTIPWGVHIASAGERQRASTKWLAKCSICEPLCASTLALAMCTPQSASIVEQTASIQC